MNRNQIFHRQNISLSYNILTIFVILYYRFNRRVRRRCRLAVKSQPMFWVRDNNNWMKFLYILPFVVKCIQYVVNIQKTFFRSLLFSYFSIPVYQQLNIINSHNGWRSFRNLQMFYSLSYSQLRWCSRCTVLVYR